MTGHAGMKASVYAAYSTADEQLNAPRRHRVKVTTLTADDYNGLQRGHRLEILIFPLSQGEAFHCAIKPTLSHLFVFDHTFRILTSQCYNIL